MLYAANQCVTGYTDYTNGKKEIPGHCGSFRMAMHFALNQQKKKGQLMELKPGRHYAHDIQISIQGLRVRGSNSSDLSQTVIVCGAHTRLGDMNGEHANALATCTDSAGNDISYIPATCTSDNRPVGSLQSKEVCENANGAWTDPVIRDTKSECEALAGSTFSSNAKTSRTSVGIPIDRFFSPVG